jgi:transcriptional regulator with XRE-family HTH domain
MLSTMNKLEFGFWVKQEREKKNWSQADLARESGLYRSIINNIENGVSNSSPTTLKALARAFNYPPDLLFEFVNLLPAKPEPSPIKRALLHISEGLPNSDIQLAITLLEQRQEYYKKNPSAKPAK